MKRGRAFPVPVFVFVSGALFVTAALAQNAGFAVATVDLERLFKAHPDTVEAEKALDAKKKELREDYQEKANALKRVLQEHQAATRRLAQAGKNPDDDLVSAAEDLLKEASELEKEVATLQTKQKADLEREFLEVKRGIIADLRDVIAVYNASGRFDVVLDASAKSANGLPQLLHAPAAEDITEEILERLEKRG